MLRQLCSLACVLQRCSSVVLLCDRLQDDLTVCCRSELNRIQWGWTLNVVASLVDSVRMHAQFVYKTVYICILSWLTTHICTSRTHHTEWKTSLVCVKSSSGLWLIDIIAYFFYIGFWHAHTDTSVLCCALKNDIERDLEHVLRCLLQYGTSS